jgi:hypothetical protein
MIKPIALFKVSYRFRPEQMATISSNLSKQLSEDFHVVVVMADIKDVELQVFYEKDFKVKSINEINKIITSQTS